MRLRDLKTFLRDHPDIIFISLKGKNFPKWQWGAISHPDLRTMDIRHKEGGIVTVFYHKEV